MTSLDRQFRALVGAFIEHTGTSARRIGAEALGGPGFMASLGRGPGKVAHPVQIRMQGGGDAAAHGGLARPDLAGHQADAPELDAVILDAVCSGSWRPDS